MTEIMTKHEIIEKLKRIRQVENRPGVEDRLEWSRLADELAPIDAVGVVLDHCEKLEKVAGLAKELRIYCLGSDASTENIMGRFDAAVNELREGSES